MYAICRVLYRAIANLTIIRIIVPGKHVIMLADQSPTIYYRDLLARILPANTRLPRQIADVNLELLQVKRWPWRTAPTQATFNQLRVARAAMQKTYPRPN